MILNNQNAIVIGVRIVIIKYLCKGVVVMSKKFVLAGICTLAALSLSGCKIDLGANVPLSALLGNEIKTANADLYVEVPACNSYEDSRQPSKGLVDAKNEINNIFPDGEYKECFKKKFDSFAHFSLPVAFGPEDKLSEKSPEIRILRNERNNVFVSLSKPLHQRLKNAKDKPSISGGFSPSDVRMFITVNNDTGKPITADYVGVFVSDYPIIIANGLSLDNGKNFAIRLSDVTTSALFLDDKNNPANFMFNVRDK